MRNKKGFTLIELLAVIIILGVLMLVAVPSVTGYIASSRRSSFASTASEFIKSVGVKVNQGIGSAYDKETLYLFPVGNDETKSCVKLESGGKSPFSNEYRYGYVGAIYDGKSYDYYLLAVDGASQGFDKKTTSDNNTVDQYIISSKTLEDEGGDLVVAGITGLSNLSDHYKGTTSYSDSVSNKKTLMLESGSTYSVAGKIKTEIKSSDGESVTHQIWTDLNSTGYVVGGSLDGHSIKKIVIVGLNDCSK